MRLRLFVVIALLFPLHAAAADAGPANVTVRVYNTSSLDASAVQQALTAAAASLRSANVDVTWLVCRKARTCSAPLRRGELTVRLVPSSGKVSGARLHGGSLLLGDAMIDAAGSGVLATVYVRHAQQLATAGIDLPTLVGRAVAHELGHLLLGSRVHSKYGLMRSSWSRDEIARKVGSDWTFAPDEAREIQARRVASSAANIVWGTE